MSVHSSVSRDAYDHTARYDEDRGAGWVAYAGILLLIVGTLNTIEGIAAIDKANFFVRDTNYIAGDLRAWGWTLLLLGIAQILVGLGIFARNQFARWAGVTVLALNAIAQLMAIPAYPFWSLAIFTIDILAIYGLVTYGSRLGRA